MDHQLFRELSWNDLDDWVGKKILNRGKSYKTDVEGLASVKDNHVVATVHGTSTYLTEVWFENEDLRSTCTCPYDWGIHCKHAVAVILVLLDQIRSNKPIPNAEDVPSARSRKASTSSESSTGEDFGQFDIKKVRAALSKIKKDELIEWCAELIVRSSSLEAELPGGIKPKTLLPEKTNVTKQQITQIRNRILYETSLRYFESEWGYGEEDYGDLPDYDQIEEDFKVLSELNCINELVMLANQLLELSSEQIDDCNLPGETYEQLRACMGVAGKALKSSDLTPVQKVVSFWEWQLEDGCDLIDEVPSPINDKKLKKDDWHSIADHFVDRLQRTPVQDDQDDYISRYRRSRILDKVVLALKSADAIPQVVELMEAELPHCRNHVELVELLIELEDFDRAKHWIVSGIREFQDRYRGVADKLLKKWREIAIRQDDWALAASVTVFFFIDDCGVDTYEPAREACQKVGIWKQIRPILLDFLETGIFDPSDPNWPLPPTGLDDIDRPCKKAYHPRYREIIEIALAENRLDDAVERFQNAPENAIPGFGVEIAPRIKDSHPEVALTIWKQTIHSLIDQTKVKAYEEAMPYLKRVRDLMSENGQSAEYEKFVAHLRTAHRKKRRLMQELDMLEHGHKKILSG